MTAKAILTIDSTEPLGVVDALRQRKAAQIAANRAANSARVVMVRAVAKRFGLKQKVVRDRIDVKPARLDAGGSPFVAFDVNATPVELVEFRARQLKRAGVKATIGGRTKTFKGAFIATVGGHRGVFRRKGKPRLPIRKMYGPSIANGVDDTFPEALARFREKFPEELYRAVRFGRSRR